MKDDAHKQTDKLLEELENEINIIYSGVKKELLDKLKTSLNWGKILEIENKNKRLIEANKKRRLQSMVSIMAGVIQNKNEIAINLIQNKEIDIFTLNYNWAAYFLEHLTGFNLGFILYNRNAVKELLLKNTPVFTKMAYLGLKDKAEIVRDLRRELTKSIILGETIKDIAKRIDNVTDKNNFGSIRIARTETTRIESSGRQKAFEHGEKKGLKLEKKWISTLDQRTRETHRYLMGKQVPLNESFKVPSLSYERNKSKVKTKAFSIKYPGDSDAPASEIIGCRCTHIVEFIGIKKGAKELELDNKLKQMTYSEWVKKHE